jgi:hypothetical protein
MSSTSIVMYYVRDLFPRQQAAPDLVANGIATHCTPDQHRHDDLSIREVVRTAGEWQGTLEPPKRLFKPARSAATQADFMSAARRAYKRFG